MGQDLGVDPDPQQLLPEELRSEWVAAPKTSLYQLLLVGLILGAGLALTTVGIAQGSKYLTLGFPVAMAVCHIQNKVFSGVERRRLEEMKSRATGKGV